MHIQAVRAVNNLLKRKPEPNYPELDMDGSAFMPAPEDDPMDEVITAVANSFGIDPFDLWDDYAEWTHNNEYMWWNSISKLSSLL
jgi:hypothetical protein